MILTFSKNVRGTYSKLVYFDVTCLYTKMPHRLGLKVIEYWSDKFPKLIQFRFNKVLIPQASKPVLRNNHFVLTNNFFIKSPELLWILLLLQLMQN